MSERTGPDVPQRRKFLAPTQVRTADRPAPIPTTLPRFPIPIGTKGYKIINGVRCLLTKILQKEIKAGFVLRLMQLLKHNFTTSPLWNTCNVAFYAARVTIIAASLRCF